MAQALVEKETKPKDNLNIALDEDVANSNFNKILNAYDPESEHKKAASEQMADELLDRYKKQKQNTGKDKQLSQRIGKLELIKSKM